MVIYITTVREALKRILEYDDDYAYETNNVGFNKLDTSFAHDVSNYHVWTNRQQQTVFKMLQKYKIQLLSYGINYDELVFEKTYEKERIKNILFLSDDATKICLKIDYKFSHGAKSIGKYPHRQWNLDLKVWTYSIDNIALISNLIDFITTLKDKVIITDEVNNIFLSKKRDIEKYKSDSKMKNNIIDETNNIKTENLKLVENIKTDYDVSEIPLPLINASLYDHQKRAFMISSLLPASALLMEQGTGKTLSALTTISKLYNDGKINKLLIIAPLSVLDVWVHEFEKFIVIPFDIKIVKGNIDTKKDAFDSKNNKENHLNVRIVNYDAIAPRKIKQKDENGKILYAIKYGKKEPIYNEVGGIYGAINNWINNDTEKTMIILDESQRIKNKNTGRSRIIYQLGDNVIYKMILTGTPITQSPMDLWSQYRFLDKSIFGTSFYKFRNEYAVMGGYKNKEIVGYKNLDELISKAHSIGYRVTKDDALDLPEYVDQYLYVDLKSSKKYYEDMYNEAKIILGESLNKVEIKTSLVITQLLRLSQITGGYITRLIKDENKNDKKEYVQIGDEKLNVLKEFIEDYPKDKKIVIVCRFIPEVIGICKMITSMGRTCDVIYGDTKNRGDIINNFQNSDNPNVLVIQIQTAGLGITLTRADTMVFYSYGYSYADMEQARARVHRVGQKNNVTYVYLVCKNTIDEIILNAISKKGKLADIVIDLLNVTNELNDDEE